MKLWIAQGFGAGWAPVAPGTFGSLVGLGWFLALALTRSWVWFILGNVAAFVISVWLCGEGERLLQKKDPGSIVLDEIAALPCCFIVWMLAASPPKQWLGPAFYVRHAGGMLAIFGLFRLFDVWKPWPIRQSQNLPGGLGVTVDDFLAALYVNLTFGAAVLFFGV